MEEVRAGDAPIEQAAAETPSRVSLARLSKAAQRGLNTQARSNVLTPRLLESIYRQEPLVQRGIKKHTGDLVKLGFTVVKAGTEEPHDGDDVVQAWLRNEFIATQVRDGLIAGHIHGNGPVEIEWDDNGDGRDPVQEGALPVAVHVIDPVGLRWLEDEDENGDAVVYLVQDRSGGNPVTLHPDRYHLFRHTILPGHFNGISTIEAAYHAALAKVKGDQALGEILYSNGTPKDVAIVKDGKAPDLDAVAEMLTDPNFVRGYVWDDRLTITRLAPGSIDPTPFYAAFKTSLAAAIGIPVAILEGVQAGAVTGSETNLTDYHSDLRQSQVTMLEPFYVRIVGALLKQDTTTFDLKWEDPPVDPARMAQRIQAQATAFSLLKDSGLTKTAAARLAGLEVTEEDFEDEPDVLPAITLPPGAQAPAEGDPAQPGQPQPSGVDDEGRDAKRRNGVAPRTR